MITIFRRRTIVWGPVTTKYRKPSSDDGILPIVLVVAGVGFGAAAGGAGGGIAGFFCAAILYGFISQELNK